MDPLLYTYIKEEGRLPDREGRAAGERPRELASTRLPPPSLTPFAQAMSPTF